MVQKKAAVAALTEGSHPLVGNFLQVLLDRGRIHDFPEVAQAFLERVARAQDRLEVEAVTAVALPDDLRSRIVKRIEEKTGSSVSLTESVEPDIVGGLVLRIGGVVVDGSVRHRIDELREALNAAPVDAASRMVVPVLPGIWGEWNRMRGGRVSSARDAPRRALIARRKLQMRSPVLSHSSRERSRPVTALAHETRCSG